MSSDPESDLAHKTENDETQEYSYPIATGCNDFWCWNRFDKSFDVVIHKELYGTIIFHPRLSNGTAGIRGNKPLNRLGRHYWEIKVADRIFGTSVMFGVGTKKARIHTDDFVNLMGEDDQSWALSYKGTVWHNGVQRCYTKPFAENVSVTIGILYDGISGTLSFYKDRKNLGVAFAHINFINEAIYPMVSCTSSNIKMSLGVRKREFTSLQDRCRDIILKYVDIQDIAYLDIPETLKDFLRSCFLDIISTF